MRSTDDGLRPGSRLVKEILDAGSGRKRFVVASVPSYTYITKQHQLDIAVSQLQSSSEMGVDIETSGYYTYLTEVCLIQISSGRFHYVIDCLVGLDLSGLSEVFGSEKTTKIFHGAASDIAELRRGTSWVFRNIFDTLYCCRVLAHDGCSLGSLTGRYFDAPLEKKEQKSNWKKRPLSASQLEYAHMDTVHLEALRARMLAELPEQLMPEIESEFEWICATSHSREKEPDPHRWMRVPDALALDPLRRGFLAALVEIREERASKENVAAFRLLTNEAMVRVARAFPRTEDELRRTGLVNPKMLRKDGVRILAAAENPTPIPDTDLPRAQESPPEVMEGVRRLKKWRRGIADFRGMDTSLIVSNRVIEEVAQKRPTDLQALGALSLLNRWKLEHYGPDMIRVAEHGYGGTFNQSVPRMVAQTTE